MSHSPNVNDENRDEVLKRIKVLEKKGTPEAADKLKASHNIDVLGKPVIAQPNGASDAKLK